MIVEDQKFEIEDSSIKSIHIETGHDVDTSENNYSQENIKQDIEFAKQNFPLNLSSSKNTDLSNYRPIYFRNYMPNDENFPTEKLTYFEKIFEIEKSYEKKVKKSVKEFLNIEKNPLSIVPKKNNVDLKRNLAKKLEKLNKKTEISILEIIKENIQTQKKELAKKEQQYENESENSNENKFINSTNLQINIQEQVLTNKYLEDQEDDGDVSSDYDKGLY
jgi:coiled-coil domain-containing protein 12